MLEVAPFGVPNMLMYGSMYILYNVHELAHVMLNASIPFLRFSSNRNVAKRY